MSENQPRVLVLIADGTEEMEAVITVDVLRRAGAEVVLAGLESDRPVVCSRGVRVVPDCALAAVEGRFDVVALPGGGGGSERFAASAELGVLLREQLEGGGTVAAICAAPSALAAHGVASGARLTAHPSVREQVAAHGEWSEDVVVIDGGVVTSRGPGSAFAFAFALVERLFGAAKVAEVRGPMMFPD